jgi:crotonobetainyl-CoA:carnitine CoA-transferase CaiB-like acyl-CoA transferase
LELNVVNPESAGPLNGLKILDISEGIAGPFCAKLLGDLGADVVKIEKPQTGDTSRSIGPFPNGKSDVELSSSFFFLNTSKRSVVLDLESPAGMAQLRALCGHFDVIVSGDTAEALASRGIGFEQLRQWNPRVILTTISGFGSYGPHSNYESSHLVACAVGGWAHLCGVPEREPLQAGGAITETLTGAFAAVATLLAALGRATHGRGEHVDVSAQEAVLAGAQMPTLLFEYRDIVPHRYSSVGSGAGAAFILPTRKGYIGLNALTLPQWQMMCKFLGREDIAQDPYYAGVSWVNPDKRIEEIREAFRAALEDRTAEELFHEAEKWRVPFGLVPDLPGLYELPPHREREFFVTLEHPVAGSVAVPGIPFKSTATRPAPYRPPLLGEHTREVFSQFDVAIDPAAAPRPSEPPQNGARNAAPLDGLRILDLSMFFAGPVAAQIAADAGADVIKVESVQRIDGWRGSATASADGVPSWENSPYFNWVNRNKRGITLNLTDPRGTDILKHLVRDADVLIENYTPRVMGNFGLSYETLRELNPRLIMLSLSGFGSDVSWRDYVAFGMSTEQLSGVSHLTGYEDDEPLFTGMTGGDLFAGVMGANALFAALHHRNRTGEGQHINLSQLEACNLYIGDVMTGWSLAEFDPGRIGNTHPVYAPQGIYPCKEERWIGITCKTDAQWLALAGLIDRPQWLEADSIFSRATIRSANRNEIDRSIGAWTQSRDCLELMALLQDSGIPAGAVMTGPDLLNDPQLRARGSFLAQDRPGVGVKHYPNQPYRFRCAEPAPNLRAPLLGEHSWEVLTELAGLTADEIAELVIADVVGTDPLAAR